MSKVSLSNTALGKTLLIIFFDETSLLRKPLIFASKIENLFCFFLYLPLPLYDLFLCFTSPHPLPPAVGSATISCPAGADWGNPPPRVGVNTGSRFPAARAYTGYRTHTRGEVLDYLVTCYPYVQCDLVSTEVALSSTG